MGHIAQDFAAYDAKWTAARIAQNWVGFCSETEAVLAVLGMRMERENCELYPLAERLVRSELHKGLGVFMEQLELDNAHFEVAELTQMLAIAEQLDRSAGSLSLRDRFIYAQAPVDSRSDDQCGQ